MTEAERRLHCIPKLRKHSRATCAILKRRLGLQNSTLSIVQVSAVDYHHHERAHCLLASVSGLSVSLLHFCLCWHVLRPIHLMHRSALLDALCFCQSRLSLTKVGIRAKIRRSQAFSVLFRICPWPLQGLAVFNSAQNYLTTKLTSRVYSKSAGMPCFPSSNSFRSLF